MTVNQCTSDAEKQMDAEKTTSLVLLACKKEMIEDFSDYIPIDSNTPTRVNLNRRRVAVRRRTYSIFYAVKPENNHDHGDVSLPQSLSRSSCQSRKLF